MSIITVSEIAQWCEELDLDKLSGILFEKNHGNLHPGVVQLVSEFGTPMHSHNSKLSENYPSITSMLSVGFSNLQSEYQKTQKLACDPDKLQRFLMNMLTVCEKACLEFYLVEFAESYAEWIPEFETILFRALVSESVLQKLHEPDQFRTRQYVQSYIFNQLLAGSEKVSDTSKKHLIDAIINIEPKNCLSNFEAYTEKRLSRLENMPSVFNLDEFKRSVSKLHDALEFRLSLSENDRNDLATTAKKKSKMHL